MKYILSILLLLFGSVVNAGPSPTSSCNQGYQTEAGAYTRCELQSDGTGAPNTACTKTTPKNICTYSGAIGEVCTDVSTQFNGHGASHDHVTTVCYYFTNESCTAPQTYNPTTQQCDDPPSTDCASKAGQSIPTIIGLGGSIPQVDTQGCHAGCQGIAVFSQGMTVTASGASTSNTAAQFQFTGAECQTSDTNFPETTDPEVTDSDGDGIPEINDTEVADPEEVPPAGCVALAGGSTQCGQAASTPPAPDTGTPGDPAQPDYNVTNNNSNTTNNIFSESTVDNSTTGTGGNVTGDGSEADSDCDPAIDPECGDDSAYQAGGQDDWYEPTILTWEGVLQDFANSVNSAPVVSQADAFLDFSVSGSCPVWTLPSTALTPSIAVDMQCSSTMNNIWPFIAAIIIASCGWFAFRIAFL